MRSYEFYVWLDRYDHAVLRIGDFSQLGRVSVRTLRLYDELDLLKPAQVDKFTDYRYYAVDQLPRLNRILVLKDLGFSLDEIKTMIDNALPATQLEAMLAKRKADVDQQIRDEQERLARIATRMAYIAREGQPPLFDIFVKHIDAHTLAGIRATVANLDEMGMERQARLSTLYGALTQHRLRTMPQHIECALYYNTEFTDEGIDMELAVTIDPKTAGALAKDAAALHIHELPACEAATTVYGGPVSDLVQAISQLYYWIGENNYASCGPMRELHLSGSELDLRSARDLVTVELQLPIERA
jgi:DNA-binding transcriptional MerR regulator